jgi:HTH-type transcriptional regulator/antitoxin HigA
MSAASAPVLANPVKMIAKGAPHVIHNDEELEAYAEALFKLTALENPSPAEMDAVELIQSPISAASRTNS